MSCKELLFRLNSAARFIGVLFLSASIFTVPAYAADSSSSAGFSAVVDAVAPAVVSVQVVEKPQSAVATITPDRPLGTLLPAAWHQEKSQPVKNSVGSGFIIDAVGDIVTSAGNVANADRITVVLADGHHYDAVVAAQDLPTNLALLKISAEAALPTVTWGDSGKTRIGDSILAMGDSFGLGQNVTLGILSARGRPVEGSDYTDFLQIDAALNPGSSGGPIIALDGTVIGITMAAISPNGANIGLGLALPAEMARTVIEQLLRTGAVTRGYLGVECQELTPDLAPSFGLPATAIGAIVLNVSPGSPAAAAGVKIGDIIQRFAGSPVRDISRIPRLVADLPAGTPVTLSVSRYGKPVILHAVTGVLPKERAVSTDAVDDAGIGSQQDALGLILAPLDSTTKRRLGLPPQFVGAIIVSVASNSPAANAGLLAGDVIERVDSQIARNSFEAAQQIFYDARNLPWRPVLLLVSRGGAEHFVAVPLDQHRD